MLKAEMKRKGDQLLVIGDQLLGKRKKGDWILEICDWRRRQEETSAEPGSVGILPAPPRVPRGG